MRDIVVDMFCGAGGESSGLIEAGEEINFKFDLYAINHWEIALQTHALNFPFAKPFSEDVFQLDPRKVVPGGLVKILWASPECTHFSIAKGGKPCDEQSRSQARQIIKWCEDLNIQRVILENVKEFMNWGPLHKRGKLKNRPIERLKGIYFRRWVKDMRSLGYTVDWRVLNTADFGDCTDRYRCFLQAVKNGKKIIWPTPTHDNQHRPMSEIIDRYLLGESIFTKKKPLCPNTIRRIEAGIRKFWGAYAEPFLIKLRGTSDAHLNSSSIPLTNPLPTITTAGNHFSLIQAQPFLVKQRGTSDARIKGSAIGLNNSLPTITAGGGHLNLVQPFITSYHGGNPNRNYSIDAPIPTIDTSNRFGLIRPAFLMKYYSTGENVEALSSPLPTVTTKDRLALLEGTYDFDILYRLLKNHELSAAHSFPASYRFAGTATDITKQIGNSVPVKTAKALFLNALKDDL